MRIEKNKNQIRLTKRCKYLYKLGTSEQMPEHSIDSLYSSIFRLLYKGTLLFSS